MTPALCARAYAQRYPGRPPLVSTSRWLCGVWEIGNDYRNKSPLHGAYPRGYLERLAVLFPSATPRTTLHLFCGTSPVDALPGLRVDLIPERRPDVVADAHALPFADGAFDLVVADPPYTPRDAERYGTPMPQARLVLREAARVARAGGSLVWLDIRKPMYRLVDWRLWGEIAVVRSTNHLVRMAFLFERGGCAA